MGGLLGFYIGRHLQDQHNAGLAAQQQHLGVYHDILTDPSLPDNVRHDVTLASIDASRKPVGWFRSSKAQQQLQSNLEKWTQESQSQAQMQPPPPPPPPANTVASQGPPQGNPQTIAPLGQMPQQSGGGEMFGPLTGQPPNASAFGVNAPQVLTPPVELPPPPGHAAAAPPPAAPARFIYDPFGASQRRATIANNMEIAKDKAKYEAMYTAMSKQQREVFDEKMNSAKQLMDETTQNNPGAHFKIEIRAGSPTVSPDPGRPLPRVYRGTELPSGTVVKSGELNPNGTYTVRVFSDGSTEAIEALTPLGTGTTASGDITQFNRYVPGAASAVGAVSPVMARPRQFTGPSGNIFLQSPASAAAGLPATPVQGAINPSFVPSTSTTTIPGQLPQTTTRTKGDGAGAPVTRGVPSATAGPGVPDNSLIGRKYQDWVGGGPAPTGKELTAVQAYAANKGLPSPTQLSPAGQANLQSVDAVFKEIDDADRILNQIKGNPSLRADYIKYKLGFHTPNDELFTKLSFEGLRSAAAALKGNGSRAYPVIQKAFEHIPSLDRFYGLKPDEIPLMKDKLKAMRDVLTDTRNTVLQDERKSGVVLTAPPGSSAVDRLVEKYGGR